MKALTVAQPWASLIVAGAKTIETRPSPPNGPMRPDGVRGLPGLRIEPGERIAIHAGASAPACGHGGQVGPHHICHKADGRWVRYSPPLLDLGPEIDLPLGAIVGTVVVAEAVLIAEEDDAIPLPCIEVGERHLSLWYPASAAPGDEANEQFITDQLPLGDFTPGRWGWLLTDPERCEPVPVRGRQGVWEWTP